MLVDHEVVFYQLEKLLNNVKYKIKLLYLHTYFLDLIGIKKRVFVYYVKYTFIIYLSEIPK